MTVPRSRAMAAGLAFVVALPLAACSFGDSGGAASGDDTIRLQVSGEPEETAVYDALAAAFMEQHPGSTIEVVKVAEKPGHLARLSTSFAAGNPPDVFLVNFREFSVYAARSALEPVGPLLEDQGLDFDDYYTPPLDAFDFDGALQCMPQNISSLVVYYNRELLKRFGVDEPPDQWSWEEFRSTAIAMTQGDVDGVGIEPSVIRLAPFVWSNGGEVVDDTETPTRFTLDEPAAREAVEFVVGLVRDDQVAPTEEEVAAQDLETRFETGKLAMLLSSRVDTPRFREVSGLAWDVAPLPQADQPVNILHSDAYCLSRPSQDKQLATEFIEFAVGQAGQTLTALGGRTVPSLKSVARSAAFLDPTQEPRRAEVWLDAVPYLRRTPVWPTWTEIEDLSEELLTRAYYDDVSLDEILTQLDERSQPLFERGGG